MVNVCKSECAYVSHVCSPGLWWQSGPYRLLHCNSCGLLWLAAGAKPCDEIYTSEYFQKYYCDSKDIRRAFFDDWLTKSGLPVGKVLDVGCGIGLFLDAARQRGFQTFGVEPSTAASRFQQAGHDIRHTSLEHAHLPLATFDLITFWDTLAHLEAPAKTLSLARGLLANGGHIIIKTPNRSARCLKTARILSVVGATRGWLHLPAQIYHFSAESLCGLLTRCGLTPTHIEYVSEPVHPSFKTLARTPTLLALRSLQRLATGNKESLIVIAEKERSYARA